MESASMRYSSLWTAFWLGLVLFGTKFVRLYGPDYYGYWELKRYLGEVAMVGANDLLFALAVGIVGQLALSSFHGTHRLERWAYRCLLIFAAACVFYGVLSMRLYDILHMPLTYPLLALGSDVTNMRSSVASFVTAQFLALLVGLPIAYLVVVAISDRLLQFKRTRFVRIMQDFRTCINWCLRGSGPSEGGERLGSALPYAQALGEPALHLRALCHCRGVQGIKTANH
jgi:hypothetical protein